MGRRGLDTRRHTRGNLSTARRIVAIPWRRPGGGESETDRRRIVADDYKHPATVPVSRIRVMYGQSNSDRTTRVDLRHGLSSRSASHGRRRTLESYVDGLG